MAWQIICWTLGANMLTFCGAALAAGNYGAATGLGVAGFVLSLISGFTVTGLFDGTWPVKCPSPLSPWVIYRRSVGLVMLMIAPGISLVLASPAGSTAGEAGVWLVVLAIPLAVVAVLLRPVEPWPVSDIATNTLRDEDKDKPVDLGPVAKGAIGLLDEAIIMAESEADQASFEQAPGDTPILFGLKAQGHLPKIHQWLCEGRPWAAIAREIGWEEKTAETYYQQHLIDEVDKHLALYGDRFPSELGEQIAAASTRHFLSRHTPIQGELRANDVREEAQHQNAPVPDRVPALDRP